MSTRQDRLLGLFGLVTLRGAPVGKAGAAAVASGILVACTAAFVSTAAALGVLAALLVGGLSLAVHAMSLRLSIAEERVEARLTLDELQRGAANWRIATPFSATPDLLIRVVREILARKPPMVVELGSGVSTVVLARIIREQRLAVQLVSVEHAADYAATVAEELEREGLRDQVILLHAPLEPLEIEGYSGLWYRVEELLREAKDVGLLIVDGPAKRFGANIRYPAVPVLKERIAPGALILLDDARRVQERRALRRWSRMIPGISSELDPAGRGIAVLRWPAFPNVLNRGT